MLRSAELRILNKVGSTVLCVELIEVPSVVHTETSQQHPVELVVGAVRVDDIAHVHQQVEVASNSIELVRIIDGTLFLPALEMGTGTNLRVKVTTEGNGSLWGDELGEVVVGERSLCSTLYRDEVIGVVVLYTLCLSSGHSEKECHRGKDIIDLFHNHLNYRYYFFSMVAYILLLWVRLGYNLMV